MTDPLIEIHDLSTHFFTEEGTVKAVDQVSLAIPRGRTLGLVGESGCGKSVTAMSVMRLVARPGQIVAGSVLLHDAGKTVDLLRLPEAQMRRVRGGKIAMIFQEPMTSLNPVYTLGAQIVEAIRLHESVNRREARQRALELLRKVRIPAPDQRMDEYPHQLSGGMRQRVMIAMALACQPSLLIADEPTTALDVTIQAQILDLLRDLQQENGMSVLLITHDLGIVAEMADEVAVMYAARIVERAPTRQLFARPHHPYTLGLFASRPRVGMRKSERLNQISGTVPSPLRFPTGCRFHTRCPYAEPVCRDEEPRLRQVGEQHTASCHFAERIRATLDERLPAFDEFQRET